MEDHEQLPIDDVEVFLEVDGARKIYIDLAAVAKRESPKAALVTLQATTKNGDVLEVPGWGHNPKLGQFRYVEAGTTVPRQQQFAAELPEGVASVHIRGHQWTQGNRVTLLGNPVVTPVGGAISPDQPTSSVRLFLPAPDFLMELPVPDGATNLDLKLTFEAPPGSPQAPISIHMLSDDGQICLPAEGLGINQTIGPYAYLTPGDDADEHSAEISINVEASSKTVRLQGHKWGKSDLRIGTNPVLTWTSQPPLQRAREFIAGIPDESTLWVVDTTAPPLGDETRALRPNNIVKALSEKGEYAIFFPFTSIQDQLAEPMDHVMQVAREHHGDIIQSVVALRPEARNVYVCSSFPSLAAACTIDMVAAAGWNTVYVIRDDMEEFNRAGYSKWYSTTLERRVLRRVDRIVTVSPALAQKASTMAPDLATPIDVLPNAVRDSTVKRNQAVRDASHWNERSLRVGYVGHLTPSWFDWRLVLQAARALPEFDFDIIGHGAPQAMSLPSNVRVLEAMTHEELEVHAHDWRAGLIPFLPSPLARGVDPNKLFEYAAWGLRTVSAPMGSVDAAPSTRVYRDPQSFIEAIQWAMTEPMTSAEMRTLDEFAKSNTWADRAQKYLAWLEDAS